MKPTRSGLCVLLVLLAPSCAALGPTEGRARTEKASVIEGIGAVLKLLTLPLWLGSDDQGC